MRATLIAFVGQNKERLKIKCLEGTENYRLRLEVESKLMP